MVVFDTSFLVVLLQETCPPVKDRQDKPVSFARERIQYLLQQLSNNNSLVCIPTPVLAEIMVRADSAAPAYLSRLSNTSKFKLSTFDVRAAIESAELIRKIKIEQRAKSVDPWAKVKFDIQIVAIAKAENASVIYADDPQIENHGERLSISVKRICDLALPPDQVPMQEGLFERSEESDPSTEISLPEIGEVVSNATTPSEQPQGTTDTNHQLQADPAHTAPVQGSDDGRAQGEATTEAKSENSEKK